MSPGAAAVCMRCGSGRCGKGVEWRDTLGVVAANGTGPCTTRLATCRTANQSASSGSRSTCMALVAQLWCVRAHKARCVQAHTARWVGGLQPWRDNDIGRGNAASATLEDALAFIHPKRFGWDAMPHEPKSSVSEFLLSNLNPGDLSRTTRETDKLYPFFPVKPAKTTIYQAEESPPAGYSMILYTARDGSRKHTGLQSSQKRSTHRGAVQPSKLRRRRGARRNDSALLEHPLKVVWTGATRKGRRSQRRRRTACRRRGRGRAAARAPRTPRRRCLSLWWRRYACGCGFDQGCWRSMNRRQVRASPPVSGRLWPRIGLLRPSVGSLRSLSPLCIGALLTGA